MGMKRAKSRSEKSASGEQSKKTANREDLFVETPISSERFELSWTNDRLTLTEEIRIGQSLTAGHVRYRLARILRSENFQRSFCKISSR